MGQGGGGGGEVTLVYHLSLPLPMTEIQGRPLLWLPVSTAAKVIVGGGGSHQNLVGGGVQPRA